MSLPKIIPNKYWRWYFNIIDKALREERIASPGSYYERHHIIPRCFGGIETVALTFREHFLCHMLLPKFVEGGRAQKQMNNALAFMLCNSNTTSRIISSWQYEAARIACSKAKIGNTYGRANKGAIRGPHSAERTAKIKAANLGKVRSVESKLKYSERQRGSKNHMFGKTGSNHHNYKKPHSDATWSKIKLTYTKNAKICEHCDKKIRANIYTRFHGMNCKFKGVTALVAQD